MKRLGDQARQLRAQELTARDIAAGLRRYQPFVATVIAGLLLVALLPEPAQQVTSPFGGASQSFAGDGVAQGVGAPGVVSPDGLDETGAPLPGGASAPGLESNPGTSPAGASVAGGGYGWQSLGTPEALGAPDCDPETGFLRLRTRFLGIPCVAMWPAGADNGGATSRGVTADKVTLVVFQAPPGSTSSLISAFGSSDAPQNFPASIQGYVDLFNRHSETYGRTVEMVLVRRSGTDAETARADVIDAIERYQPFALFQAEQTTGSSPAIPAAQRGVLATGNEPGTALSDPSFLHEHGPFLWNATYGPPNPYAAAEVLCQIQGLPARWAGDPVLRTQTRKFGWIFEDVPSRAWYNSELRAALERCGLTYVSAGVNTASQAEAAQQMTAIMARFRSEGVTTVGLSGQVQLMVASAPATGQGYFPEWFSNQLNTFTVRLLWDRSQSQNMFGIAADGVPAPRPPVDKQHHNVLYEWEHGRPSPSVSSGQFHAQMVSWLFQGIALAGPNLTPETFRDGLFHMTPAGGSFSNAVTENGRAYGPQSYWPFPFDNYSAAAGDYRLGYFDPNVTCFDEGNIRAQGCITWIESGRRYPVGQLAEGEPPYFEDPGARASLDDLPPNEVPPDYPNKRDCANRQECWGS